MSKFKLNHTEENVSDSISQYVCTERSVKGSVSDYDVVYSKCENGRYKIFVKANTYILHLVFDPNSFQRLFGNKLSNSEKTIYVPTLLCVLNQINTSKSIYNFKLIKLICSSVVEAKYIVVKKDCLNSATRRLCV